MRCGLRHHATNDGNVYRVRVFEDKGRYGFVIVVHNDGVDRDKVILRAGNFDTPEDAAESAALVMNHLAPLG